MKDLLIVIFTTRRDYTLVIMSLLPSGTWLYNVNNGVVDERAIIMNKTHYNEFKLNLADFNHVTIEL